MGKTYSTNAIEWKGMFIINGKLTPITFTGGRSGNARRVKARYTTSDKNVQDSIESDPRYGKTVFLEALYEEVKVEKLEDIPGKKVYPARSIQEAQNILATEYGFKLSELNNKTKIRDAAAKCNIVFPNFK